MIAVAYARTVDDLIKTIQQSILDPITYLLLVLGAVVFLYGVVEFIAGAANEDARTKGKSHMIWGLLGLLIMISVEAIITILKNFFK
ncbi:MAG: hypothetical protein Q8Q46_00940 [Candidatus Giovannonibacteria bacterium]|nr:hypothetical protein [Candidatus Giovannonibacteria bacterium]